MNMTQTPVRLEHFGNGKTLMQFQAEGLQFVEATDGNCMIGDVPGLGKTIQALAYLALHPEQRPVVIVPPSTMKIKWREEAEAWLETEDRITVVNTGKTKHLDADIVIINYDILKKWLPELHRIGPQVLILDESHSCFPYETMISTDQGLLQIGDIVENKRDITVLCYDLDNNKTEWRRIAHHFKNPKPISTIKVNHEYGEIICTTNHRIWTDRGYVTAEEISSGTNLRVLRKPVHDSEEGEDYSEVLLSSVRHTKKIGRPGLPCTVEQSNEKAIGAEGLRVVRETLRDPIRGKDLKEQAVLQRQLRSIVEDDTAGAEGTISTSYTDSARSKSGNEIARDLRTNEEKQSDAQSRDAEEGIRDLASDEAQTSSTRRERQTIATPSTNAIGCVRDGMASRACCPTGGLQGRIPDTLQDRHSEPNTDDSDRSGREFPLQPDVIRSEKGYEVIWSRVDDVEVLESSDTGRHGRGFETGESVYNIEVEEYHNYFANGVLVANCKNPKSARSKAAKELADTIPHKILLTGTPVLSRPAELWHQLEIIDPDQYNKSNWFQWHLRYTDAHQIKIGYDRKLNKPRMAWDFSGASNLDELATSLKSIMIRRTKDEVLPELPAKRRSTVLIPIDNRKEYDRADKEFLEWIAEQSGAEAAERASHVEQLAKIEYLRQIAIQGKMKQALAWIENFLESGEKLVVFATHRATVHALEREYGTMAVKIDGSTAVQARQAAVDKFQNDPKVKLFIGNIKAAGVGITLTSASNVVFLEVPWTPSELEQASDRCHRIGQKNAVNVYYILGADTIDQSIGAMLVDKKKVINEIMDEKGIDALEELII